MKIKELAAISQREFESIRNEMATREELKSTEGAILRAIEGVGVQLSQHALHWNAEFERLSDQVQDIGNRLKLVESHARDP